MAIRGTRIPDINFVGGSGGSGGSGALLFKLLSAETGSSAGQNNNTLVDGFSGPNLGSKTNVTQSSSALVFPDGQTTGNYLRTSRASVNLSEMDGALVASLRAGAPIATAWSPTPTSSSATIIFSGDLTQIFSSGKTVGVYLQDTIDGSIKQIWATNLLNNIAQLSVTSSVYSSITNQTTVVVSNPDLIDLSMGLSAVDYPSKLRIAPFNITFKARSNNSDTLSAASITDAGIFQPPTVKISGESLAAAITAAGLNGSAIAAHPARSPNGQYYIAKVTEQGSSVVNFHWFYSIDYGNTWSKYPTTRTWGTITAQKDDLADGTHGIAYLNAMQQVVANNGKWFSIYANFDGSITSTKGMYGDLSQVSPTISDTPGIANDASNFNTIYSGVAGYIFSRSSVEESAPLFVEADLSDLGFIIVGCQISANNAVILQQFTNGGATSGVRNADAAGYSWFASAIMVRCLVSGTSPNHVFSVFSVDTTSTGRWKLWQEGVAGTPIGTSGFPSPLENTGVMGASVNPSSGKIYSLNPNTNTAYLISGTNTASPGLTSRFLYHRQPAPYSGGPDNTNFSFMRCSKHRVVIDPNNDNHVFAAWDALNTSGNGLPGYTAYMAEIYDNDYVGEVTNQTTYNAQVALGDATARTWIGQTFTTVGATRCRTVAVSASAMGTQFHDFGKNITCEIYATSGGLPTGAALGTSINSYDARRMYSNQSAGGYAMELLFNFNNIPLSASTTYALVLKSTAAISSTKYTAFASNSAGSGNVVYNGSVWSAGTGALVFHVYGEYIYDMSNGDIDIQTVGWKNGDSLNAMEHQIELTTAGTLVSSYRLTSSSDGSRWIMSGHVRRTPVSISGSSALASSIGTRQVAGFASGTHDPYLVLSVAPGTTLCSRINTSTGVIDTTRQSEDRSGFMVPVTRYSSVTYAADADFQTGLCSVHDGVTDRGWAYSNYHGLDFDGHTWAIECEVKGIVSTGNLQFIVADVDGGGNGFYFWLTPTGYLQFQTFSGGAGPTVTASDISEFSIPTYHKLRFVWDGTIGRLYRSTVAPYTTFTEVASYSSQAIAGPGGVSTLPPYVADNNAGIQMLNGKLGYIKISKGFDPTIGPFAYDGFKDQSPEVSHQNLGDLISSKKVTGQNANALQTVFYTFSKLDQNANTNSLKDVYSTTFMVNKSMLAGKFPTLEIDWSRSGNKDTSRIEGVIAEYSK